MSARWKLRIDYRNPAEAPHERDLSAFSELDGLEPDAVGKVTVTSVLLLPPDPHRPSSELETYLSLVVGAVEATDFEKSALWKDYRETWKHAPFGGYLHCVGRVGEARVMVSFMVEEVAGRKLLFWHPTSPTVSYDLINAWLLRYLPAKARGNQTDAGNFSTVLT